MKSSISLLAKLLLVSLAVMLCFGCGRCKQDLETAKQQIDRLNAEVQKSNEVAAGIEKEKIQLRDELKTVSDKSAAAQNDLAEMKKARSSLEEQNAKLKKTNTELQDESNTLKRQKTDLEQQMEELKKRLPESPPLGRPSEILPGGSDQGRPAGGPALRPHENLSPCDAVVEFMKKSEGIVRQNRGDERKKLLAGVKEEYAPIMARAPAKAVKAAEAWVNELTSSWDQPGGDMVYRLLVKRNAVLDACGKKPQDAGF